MRIYSIDTTNMEYHVVTKVYANTGSARNAGLELLLSQTVGKIRKLSGSINLYKNIISAYQGEILFPYPHSFDIGETHDNTMDIKLNSQFDLPYDFQVQLTAIYYAPKNIPQGTQAARSSIDLGVKKKIFNGKGELSFVAADIFNRFGIDQQIIQNDITISYQNYYETQVFRIGMKYKF